MKNKVKLYFSKIQKNGFVGDAVFSIFSLVPFSLISAFIVDGAHMGITSSIALVIPIVISSYLYGIVVPSLVYFSGSVTLIIQGSGNEHSTIYYYIIIQYVIFAIMIISWFARFRKVYEEIGIAVEVLSKIRTWKFFLWMIVIIFVTWWLIVYVLFFGHPKNASWLWHVFISPFTLSISIISLWLILCIFALFVELAWEQGTTLHKQFIVFKNIRIQLGAFLFAKRVNIGLTVYFYLLVSITFGVLYYYMDNCIPSAATHSNDSVKWVR